jgi:hypothetical protein
MPEIPKRLEPTKQTIRELYARWSGPRSRSRLSFRQRKRLSGVSI